MTAMNRETKLGDELGTLRSLSDEAAPREQRRQLLDSLRADSFTEPEHQVVFESIRALFPQGPVTRAQLRVHLTRRGFPDTDVEKYFRAESTDKIPQTRTGKSST